MNNGDDDDDDDLVRRSNNEGAGRQKVQTVGAMKTSRTQKAKNKTDAVNLIV
jgi:hypothetical protein